MSRIVPVTLIVSGTFLIVAPYLFNAVELDQIAALMIRYGKGAELTPCLPNWINEFCMIAGLTMVVIGSVFGLRREEVGR